jgi:hypothetical protein
MNARFAYSLLMVLVLVLLAPAHAVFAQALTPEQKLLREI